MKRIFVLFAALLVAACSSQTELFSGDLATLPEGKEIRMEGILEKSMSKTGLFEYSLARAWLTYDNLHDVWITFDDDFPLEELLNRKVIVKGRIHHFNNCPPRQDPDVPEQCMIAEQLQVQSIREP